jgi:hypothetical protein
MSTFGNNIQSSSKRRTDIAFSLLISTLLIACPVKAQDASGLGLDQDSLLPPEVVPLDPASASQMASSQAQSRASDMASAPGLSSPQASPSNMLPQNGGGSSAQDFRKDAYNSLYNQGSLPAAQNNSGLQGMQGQMGSTPGQLGNGSMPGQQSNLGQSPWMAANGAPQQQTLMGGVQNPPSQHGNAKFNTAKHVLSTAAGFGGGMAVGAMMFSRGSSSPAAALGMGLLGAGMLNYGLRNAFRF